MIPLLVVLGGAIGAPMRYATDRFVQSRLGSAFPWGTLLVNTVGSFVLGLVLATTASAATIALVGTGFCGALTTYSTFGLETVALATAGRRLLAVANAVGSVLVGLAAAASGLALGTVLAG